MMLDSGVEPGLRPPRRMFGYFQSQQNQSTLLRCPAEIVSLILRSLLVREAPIPKPSDVFLKDEDRLELQVLQTCQLMYSIGTRIFRLQNTLRIPIDLGAARLEDHPNTHLNILYTQLSIPTTRLTQHDLIKTQLHNFRKVMLHVEPGKPLSHASMWLVRYLRNLGDLLRDKQVLVNVDHFNYWQKGSPPGHQYSTSFEKFIISTAARLVGPFALIRCRRFDFAMVPEREYAHIMAVVESEDAVVDLPALAEKLLETLQDCDNESENMELDREDVEHFKNLMEAAYKYDVRSFELHQQLILDRAFLFGNRLRTELHPADPL